MTRRYLFTIANSGHEDLDYVHVSNLSKEYAAKKWGAEYIFHTGINGYVKQPHNKYTGYYEKFELFDRCDGDIFFTDSDVVIRAGCENPFETLDSGAFHAERESQTLVKARYYEELWPQTWKRYNALTESSWETEPGTRCPIVYNTGVMYIPKKVRDFVVENIEPIRQQVHEMTSRLTRGCSEQDVLNYLMTLYSRQGHFGLSPLHPRWNVHVSLEWKKLRGKYPWERFRRYRYWRNQAYWVPDARFHPDTFCVHYTGASRPLLLQEWEEHFAPEWASAGT